MNRTDSLLNVAQAVGEARRAAERAPLGKSHQTDMLEYHLKLAFYYAVEMVADGASVMREVTRATLDASEEKHWSETFSEEKEKCIAP